MAERLEKAGRCTCGMLKIEFVREASEDDEQRSELFVREQPS